MALRPKHSVCVVCGDMVFKDTTRPYDLTSNPEGYGPPNPNYGAVMPYTASFTPPGATVPTLVLDLNDDPPAPDGDGDYVWVLPPSRFGLAPNVRLKSGVWGIKVLFGSMAMPINVLVFDEIEARVSSCICQDPCKVVLWAQLHAAKMLFSCHKTKEAQRMIDRLYKETECCCGCSGC